MWWGVETKNPNSVSLDENPGVYRSFISLNGSQPGRGPENVHDRDEGSFEEKVGGPIRQGVGVRTGVMVKGLTEGVVGGVDRIGRQ